MRYYLAHSGVKKMHWHQRRWQNPDGSLTDAGFIHYYGHPRIRKKKEVVFDDFLNKDGTLNRAGEEKLKSLEWRNIEKGKRNEKDQKYVTEYVKAMHKRLSKAGYDDETGTISKKAKVRRFAGESDDTKYADKPKYASITNFDREQYKLWSRRGELFEDKNEKLYEYTYRPTKELNIAKAKDIYDYLYSHFGDKKIKSFQVESPEADIFYYAFVDKFGNTKIKDFQESMKISANVVSVDQKGKSATHVDRYMSDYADAMNKLNAKFIVSTLYTGGPTKQNKELQKYFKSKGYDAMVDIQDAMINDLPIIIFDPKESLTLKKKKRLSRITNFDG